MRGVLVVLEGAEGVGKTTQLKRLADRARAGGLAVEVVREPGGTPLGDEVRRLLLDAPLQVAPRAEALLFMASRAQLVDDLVRPALEAGKVVLTDRFFLSTYAYQIAGRGLDAEAVRMANQLATAGLAPDVTILLDLPPGDGVSRAAARSAPDRVERSGAEFHQRVALAFREFATGAWQREHPECGPIVLVDATGSASQVEARIWDQLALARPETFGGVRGSHTGT
ncbi:MAG: dTMP kinase [Gemmatimonadaceae bacterium]|nr:dTMP kinase [Gemmatimonadaceae bacterium]